MLAAARTRIARFSPVEARDSNGLIVDLRCGDVRERLGIVPGSVHVPRSVLEWRADASSGWSNPVLHGRKLILMCDQGYSSSLAAASLSELGVDAGDMDGGFDAWAGAGLAITPAPPSGGGLPGMGGPQ